ncbi:MAG TPA: protein phosphatase 2C domain-containing protein [Gemmatimonadales bacterium]|nr:protein phosphatase 2C domain-containing protein [Gemmatimonadales bacterium]
MTPSTPRKPDDDEIDVFGLSHAGKVRPDNQDHFLLASLHKRLTVHQTNLTAAERLPFADRRLAFIAMIADGVGGGVGGAEASATTLETATEYILGSMDCYDRADPGGDETTFTNALQDAAMRAHRAVVERAEADKDRGRGATTLTLWMGVWPWYYLLQVGDSRYYLYREGKLSQLTRDQTMAQDLVDQGVWTRSAGAQSRLANVLSSSIGGETTMPVVTRLKADWENVHLLCSDGLTKHVTDERIAERLATMTSARQVCEQLLQDALDGGGSDNISIIVGLARPRPGR